ncbi:MAG: tRNA uracil 4-sulfurtransferase ThiI, partial [Candidatus Uhrbacteria bacterium]
VKNDFDLIQETALELVRSSESDWQTFKVITKRSHKLFPATSMEVSRDVGARVLEQTKKAVDIHNPDLTIQIEITEKQTYIFTEKIPGAGGLPVGSSGTVVSLLSGGIDSPVASWQLMKRGCQVIFVHFHSAPQTSQEAIDKVQELSELLSPWQIKTKLYLVPFLNIQKEIVKECRGEYRVVLYRRFMYRIAEQIAEQENAKALVTGESVGQVASQTIENIATINDAVTIPILRPLIGLDKIEIIDRAKQIGTYELSILPHEDCCSLFVPRHPVTKSNIGVARKEEGKLDVDKLITNAIKDGWENSSNGSLIRS